MGQKSRKIVCVGNRLAAGDSAGPIVYDYLAGRELPPDVQLVDGGLAGLDLLRFIDATARVIFVDSVAGFEADDGVRVFSLEEIVASTSCSSYSHADGLLYLLHSIPELFRDQQPEVYLVGIRGKPHSRLIRNAAETSLRLVMDSQ